MNRRRGLLGIPTSSRGVILIVVLGVLVLIALLATSFATLQSIERRVTRNYTDQVRAKLLAQSGVDAAITRLNDIACVQGWFADGYKFNRSWFYGGRIEDPSRLFDAEARNLNPQTGSPMEPAERVDTLRTPIERALRPSFAAEKDNPSDVMVQDPTNSVATPWSISVDGTPRGFSGVVSGTYAAHGDFYALKITDCQSQINVNDGAAWGQNHSVSQNLRRILNILGNQPSVAVPNLGDSIVSRRPPLGYQSKFDLLRAVGYDHAVFNRFRDYVTTQSWTNDQVQNPVPLSEVEDTPANYPVRFDRPTDASGRKIYRLGHGKNRMGDGDMSGRAGVFGVWKKLNPFLIVVPQTIPVRGKIDDRAHPWPLRFFDPSMEAGWPDSGTPWQAAVWSYEALHPQWVETVSRSPINVNTVTKEVLIALIADVQGFFVNSRRFPNPRTIGYHFSNLRYYYDPELSDVPPLIGEYYGSERAEVKHGEIGHLYRTTPFAGPGGQNSPGAAGNLSAESIAEEILSCRERKPSVHLPGVDYSAQPFGGPFRSFTQFNRFLDFLVEQGLIADNRVGLFFDYTFSGHVSKTSDSPIQRRLASQAAADALKANFNPNVHLNELNPDRPLWLQVDKTDLLVNSTELCFVPMGCFEIESEGCIVRPKTGSDVLSGDNDLIAQAKVWAIVKLYDAAYVGLQRDFYQGAFHERQAVNPTTHNNRATESGPEPDNGPQPLECGWDGYVSLPTLGGEKEGDPTWEKPKGELRTTYSVPGYYPQAATSPAGTPESGSSIHAHFTYDMVAHHHEAGAALCRPIGPASNTPGTFRPVKRKDYWYGFSAGDDEAVVRAKALSNADKDSYFTGTINRKVIFIYLYQPLPTLMHWHVVVQADSDPPITYVEPSRNFPSVPETISGPYCPPMSGLAAGSPEPHRYRLCRSFSVGPKIQAADTTLVAPTAPVKYAYAPSNLRIDGAYVDIHSAFGYDIKTTRVNTWAVASFWYKPNYFPECTTRIKTLLSMTNYTQVYAIGRGDWDDASYYIPHLPFALFFLPHYDGLAAPASPYDEYSPSRPASFLWAFGIDRPSMWKSPSGGLGLVSPTLNNKFLPRALGTDDFDRFTGGPAGAKKFNALRHHEWHHIVVAAAAGKGNNPGPASTTEPLARRLWMYVDGQELPFTSATFPHPYYNTPDTPDDLSATLHGDSIRIGGEYSTTGTIDPWGNLVPGNTIISRDANGVMKSSSANYMYYADGTIDEFYFWRNTDARTQAREQFAVGRYYRPDDSDPLDGLFTSAEVTLKYSRRNLPPPNDPSLGGPPTSGGSTIVNAAIVPDRKRRVIAVAWSVVPEETKAGVEPDGATPRLEPQFRDYHPMMIGKPPAPLAIDAATSDSNGYNYPTAAPLWLIKEGQAQAILGPYYQEAWSPVREMILDDADRVKFRLKLRVGKSGLNTALLATPFVDDVLIFYGGAQAEYLCYAELHE